MNEGELAAPGTPVFLFAGRTQARQWVLRCGVSDRNWARLVKGDKATVSFDAFPGEAFQGVVSSIAQGADAASGLYQVEVKVFPGKRTLAAGLSERGPWRPAKTAAALPFPWMRWWKATATRRKYLWRTTTWPPRWMSACWSLIYPVRRGPRRPCRG